MMSLTGPVQVYLLNLPQLNSLWRDLGRVEQRVVVEGLALVRHTHFEIVAQPQPRAFSPSAERLQETIRNLLELIGI